MYSCLWLQILFFVTSIWISIGLLLRRTLRRLESSQSNQIYFIHYAFVLLTAAFGSNFNKTAGSEWQTA
jgi:hypothetical protein